jgi:hypothetical protein
MPTNRAYVRRPHRSRLTGAQELDLWLGSDQPPFASPEDRRAAWLQHRDRLAGVLPSSPGRRAQAWWAFEAPAGLTFNYDTERSTLFAHGLVSDEEREQLLAEWKAEFDKAQARGFALTLGPGEVLYGAAARRAHYCWADIPPALVREWTAQRKPLKRKSAPCCHGAQF